MIGAVIDLAAKIITGVRGAVNKKLRTENRLLKAILKKTNQKKRIEHEIETVKDGRPVIDFDGHD